MITENDIIGVPIDCVMMSIAEDRTLKLEQAIYGSSLPKITTSEHDMIERWWEHEIGGLSLDSRECAAIQIAFIKRALDMRINPNVANCWDYIEHAFDRLDAWYEIMSEKGCP